MCSRGAAISAEVDGPGAEYSLTVNDPKLTGPDISGEWVFVNGAAENMIVIRDGSTFVGTFTGTGANGPLQSTWSGSVVKVLDGEGNPIYRWQGTHWSDDGGTIVEGTLDCSVTEDYMYCPFGNVQVTLNRLKSET